ncbi:MAG: T9SS type A sorting domain-containing protein [Chitinophagaceae bacterium]|nr:T9SS type A sorting domain-containing protein [Chitinophagaceae bacterium]
MKTRKYVPQIAILVMALFFTYRTSAQVTADWSLSPNLYKYSSNGYAVQGDSKIVTASDGSIIVAGSATDGALYNSITNPAAGRVIIQKYSSTGTLLSEYLDVDADWGDAPLLYPIGLNNGVLDLLIDEADNIYFIETQSDIVTVGTTLYKGIRAVVKLDANMNLEWKHTSPDNNWLSMIFDSEGNVIVNGSTKNNGDGSSSNIVTAKYNISGDLLWTVVFPGNGNYVDYGNDVSADASGNSYVTGGIGTAASGLSAITIKYDADGNQLWTSSYDFNVASTASDQGGSIVTAPNGNTYVVLTSDVGVGKNRPIILKYNTSGELIWNINIEADAPNGQLYPVRIRLDANENVYMGAYRYRAHIGSLYSEWGYSIQLYKFKADGTFRWNAKKSTARLYDFDVTASGDVYVAGTSGTSAQTFAARYNKAGNLIWEDVYSPDVIEQQTFSTSGGSCVGINPNHPDEVTIGGNVIVKNASNVYSTAWVVRHFGGTLKTGNALLTTGDLHLQVSPNPAGDLVQLSIDNNESVTGTLQVFDVSGKLMETISAVDFTNGNSITLNTSTWNSGIYFCKITSAENNLLKPVKLLVQH